MYLYDYWLIDNLEYMGIVNMLYKECKALLSETLSQTASLGDTLYLTKFEQALYTIIMLLKVEANFLSLSADIIEHTGDEEILRFVNESLQNFIENELLPSMTRFMISLKASRNFKASRLANMHELLLQQIIKIRFHYAEKYAVDCSKEDDDIRKAFENVKS